MTGDLSIETVNTKKLREESKNGRIKPQSQNKEIQHIAYFIIFACIPINAGPLISILRFLLVM
jgi:hypothetical protein